MTKLRELARHQSCVRCGADDETVVLCHYTGARRLDYGGGYGIKSHDLIGAHLCARCHREMDTLSRDKANRWNHSEEFLHCVALTLIRLWKQGKLRT